MSGNTALKNLPSNNNKSSSTKSTSDTSNQDAISTISKRQSQELLIGLCGLIGSGMHSVRDCLEKELKSMGYEIQHIHISSLIKTFFYPDEPEHKKADRYKRYQELGNNVREKYGPQILAEAAISEIAKQQKEVKIAEGKEQDKDWKFSKKVAYIIDQLKNPSEVELLRLVYQHNFYYIGVIRSEKERKRNLTDEGITKQEADELIHLDKKSNGDNGQQTEKAILDADFYLRNTQSHHTDLQTKLKRFIALIHGVNGITPTKDEKGLFFAFSASLQSACLSRQVGAAIMDDNGNILSTGRNDVPKSGGGLYSYEDKENDFRCVHKGGKCYNDIYKAQIKESIEDIIKESLNLKNRKSQDYYPANLIELENTQNTSEENQVSLTFNEEQLKQLSESKFTLSDALIEKIVDSIFKTTRLGSLIEFSRSIHAEMDAITSLARLEGESTKGKILYCTTYPCHNCARHIVAAGIKKVIYIEPYEKSLALNLHDDAITDNNENSKVIFSTFEGISPRRYQKFFFAAGERKDKGIALQIANKYSNHVDIQFLDSAQTFQVKIFSDFKKKINQPNENNTAV